MTAGNDVGTEPASCVVCGTGSATPAAAGTDYDYGTTAQEFRFVRCVACGHHYLNPRPTLASAGRIYPADYYTVAGVHRRGALGVIKDKVVAWRLRALLRELPPGGSVLEIGCGDGSLLLGVRLARPDAAVFGADLDFPESLRRTLTGAGIGLIQGPAEAVDLGGPHDLVIMNQLIEHLWDVDRVLSAVRRSMRDGGLLSVATPDPEGYDRRLSARGAWGGYYFPRHLNLFSAAALRTLLSRTGFEVVSQRRLVAPLVWIGTLRAVLARRGSGLAHRVRDGNLVALGVFTLLDLCAMALGCRTSNQLVNARAAPGRPTA